MYTYLGAIYNPHGQRPRPPLPPCGQTWTFWEPPLPPRLSTWFVDDPQLNLQFSELNITPSVSPNLGIFKDF